MLCPHCRTTIHGDPFTLGGHFKDKDGLWGICHQVCPKCGRLILQLGRTSGGWSGNKQGEHLLTNQPSFLVYPKAASHAPPPSEVPAEIAEDFREASLVLIDSPKASAALSRRCLQNLLRGYGGVTPSTLSQEIDEIIPKLPSFLGNAVDAIRNIGNFAAHPSKSKLTGEIVPVEPGEAQWLLDVLEQLFDFYFIQPAMLKSRRDSLNAKLAEIGKPPLKK